MNEPTLTDEATENFLSDYSRRDLMIAVRDGLLRLDDDGRLFVRSCHDFVREQLRREGRL